MQQTALAQIAASWKDMYGVEAQLATVPDEQLLGQYRDVARMLTDGAEAMSSSATYAAEARPLPEPSERPGDAGATPRQTALERPMSPWATRDTSPIGAGQDRAVSDIRHDDDTLSLALRELSPGWTSKELAALMRRDQRTAQRKIAKWVEQGWAKDVGDGRYDFTITEV